MRVGPLLLIPPVLGNFRLYVLLMLIVEVVDFDIFVEQVISFHF